MRDYDIELARAVGRAGEVCPVQSEWDKLNDENARLYKQGKTRFAYQRVPGDPTKANEKGDGYAEPLGRVVLVAFLGASEEVIRLAALRPNAYRTFEWSPIKIDGWTAMYNTGALGKSPNRESWMSDYPLTQTKIFVMQEFSHPPRDPERYARRAAAGIFGALSPEVRTRLSYAADDEIKRLAGIQKSQKDSAAARRESYLATVAARRAAKREAASKARRENWARLAEAAGMSVEEFTLAEAEKYRQRISPEAA